MSKRSKLEIVRDILKIINDYRNSIRITPLIRKSNLSTKRFNEYFSELEEKGFVIRRIEKNEKVVSLTEKGKKYLEKYANIVGFIEEFGL